MTEFLSLKCAPDVLGTVGYLGGKPEKEITEAWAIIKKLRKVVLKEPNKYQLVDLCSGNALVPVIATHLLPFTKTYAIDKLKRDRNWNHAKNFRYVTSDIEHISLSIFDKPTIITAVHCCRKTAETVINIFNETRDIKHMLLMPCCVGSLNSGLLQFIRNEANRDVAWITKLSLMCDNAVKISRDNHVLSPKNYIIMASKHE